MQEYIEWNALAISGRNGKTKGAACFGFWPAAAAEVYGVRFARLCCLWRGVNRHGRKVQNCAPELGLNTVRCFGRAYDTEISA